MKAIINRFKSELSLDRLVYRLIKRYGPIEQDLLTTLVGHVFCRLYPWICSSIESASVYITMQYHTNVGIILLRLESLEYIQKIRYSEDGEYIVRK